MSRSWVDLWHWRRQRATWTNPPFAKWIAWDENKQGADHIQHLQTGNLMQHISFFWGMAWLGKGSKKKLNMWAIILYCKMWSGLDGNLSDSSSAVQTSLICGVIDDSNNPEKAIDERVFTYFREKNAVFTHFRDKIAVFTYFCNKNAVLHIFATKILYLHIFVTKYIQCLAFNLLYWSITNLFNR